MNDHPPGNMPTLGDQPPSSGSSIPPQPPRQRLPVPMPEPRSGSSGYSPLWILTAAAMGFILPICACAILFWSGIAGVGTLLDQISEYEQADTGTGPGVGIVDLQGVILPGEDMSTASSGKLKQDLQWMADNHDVKAIVIMANSPGGDANASDIIWYEISKLEKPVYVAIDGLCASGCYYAAMGATPDHIYATPNSLIGSIGVISTFFNIEELAADIGVEVKIVATGANKDFGSMFRAMTEDEEAYWRDQIRVIFDTFIRRVADGRSSHLSEKDVRELANGRVWTSSVAQKMGLIDEILYPDEVINLAAQDAGLKSDFRIIESPYQPDLLDTLMSVDGSGFTGKLSVNLPDASQLNDMLQQSPIQYRYFGPYGGSE